MTSSDPQKTTKIQEPVVEIKDSQPGTITKSPSKTGPEPVWQEWIDIALGYLSKLPEEIGNFFSDYQKPLLTLGFIIGGFVVAYLTLAVLDALDDIPLLSPVLELVGLSYTGWFVWRYLWKANTRNELLAEFEALKAQVVGKDSQNS